MLCKKTAPVKKRHFYIKNLLFYNSDIVKILLSYKIYICKKPDFLRKNAGFLQLYNCKNAGNLQFSFVKKRPGTHNFQTT